MSEAWLRRLGCGVAVAATCATHVLACGPFFPDRLLAQGDAAVLTAHAIRFDDALLEILGPQREPERDPGEFTREFAEAADLGDALRERPVPERAALIAAHEAFRARLEAQPGEPGDVPAGLPREFDLYLRGAAAWHAGKRDVAVHEWRRLLELPAAERRHRSTWAAFMIGRARLASAPDEAVQWFRRVREPARGGPKDYLGLAEASVGMEARGCLVAGRFADALRIYAGQYRAGTPGSAESIRMTCRRAAGRGVNDAYEPLPGADESALRAIATSEEPRRLYTAYLAAVVPAPSAAGAAWIDALSAAGVKSVPEAAHAAWVAYRAARFDDAMRWAALAPRDSALGQWVRAKLLLRDGKLDEAAPLLAGVRAGLPPSARAPDFGELDGPYPRGPHARAAAELGTVQLARGAYTEALDALLSGGAWVDAAYVAERVMTVEELEGFVGSRFAAPAPRPPGEWWRNVGLVHPQFTSPGALAYATRWLLARRLGRAGRLADALPYYPDDVRKDAEALLRASTEGHDASRPIGDRADALWAAAVLARRRGLEILGTEVDPDWMAYGADFEDTGAAALRAPDSKNRPRVDFWSSDIEPGDPPEGVTVFRIVRATPDELARAARHAPSPDKRFHYRYVAADLAWEAAQLMPDQTDRLARVLTTAGRWLAGRDPAAADRFYRALVRRCGRTELGREADRLRWFPEPKESDP